MIYRFNMEIQTIAQGLKAIGREIASGIYETYYEAKTEYENLDEMQKTMLAIYEMKYGEEKTQSEITRKALADSEYQDWIRGLNEARRKMNSAYAKVKSVEARTSVYQSLNKHIQYEDYGGTETYKNGNSIC